MKKIDYKLFFLSIIAGLLGIIMIYSASNIWAEYKFNDSLKYVKHQTLFFIIGILIMIILSKMLYAFLDSKDIKQQYIIIISILFAVIVYILVLAILMLSEIIKIFKDKKIFFINKIKKSKLES